MHSKKWGLLEGEPPTVGVELGRIDNARHRFLSPAQLQALLAEVERRDPNAWEFVLAAGVDARTIMELFGWSTLAMLQRYTHPGAEAKARAVAALGLLWVPSRARWCPSASGPRGSPVNGPLTKH